MSRLLKPIKLIVKTYDYVDTISFIFLMKGIDKDIVYKDKLLSKILERPFDFLERDIAKGYLGWTIEYHKDDIDINEIHKLIKIISTYNFAIYNKRVQNYKTQTDILMSMIKKCGKKYIDQEKFKKDMHIERKPIFLDYNWLLSLKDFTKASNVDLSDLRVRDEILLKDIEG